LSLYAGHQIVMELLRSHVPAGATIVDAGAFPGTLTRAIRDAGWRVLAFDKEPYRSVSLQHQFNERKQFDYRSDRSDVAFSDAMAQIGVETRAVDLELNRFPAESETADAVVLTEVIEHLWIDPLWALAEVNRILRPNGIVLLSTPNLLSLRNRFNLLFGRMDRVIEHPFLAYMQKRRLGHMGHVRLYAPGELEDLLYLLGFDSEFTFHSAGYWDVVPEESAAQEVNTQPSMPISDRIKRGTRYIRTPRQYAEAVVATVRTRLEKAIPRFRAHMFVVARKRESIDLEALSLEAVQSGLHRVRRNTHTT
jgi:SAM-dependent methyltransferase